MKNNKNKFFTCLFWLSLIFLVLFIITMFFGHCTSASTVDASYLYFVTPANRNAAVSTTPDIFLGSLTNRVSSSGLIFQPGDYYVENSPGWITFIFMSPYTFPASSVDFVIYMQPTFASVLLSTQNTSFAGLSVVNSTRGTSHSQNFPLFNGPVVPSMSYTYRPWGSGLGSIFWGDIMYFYFSYTTVGPTGSVSFASALTPRQVKSLFNFSFQHTLVTLDYYFENYYENTYAAGFAAGFDTGVRLGTSVGFADGMAQGQTLGFQLGFDQGLQQGFQSGYSAGLADGAAGANYFGILINGFFAFFNALNTAQLLPGLTVGMFVGFLLVLSLVGSFIGIGGD